MGVNFNICLQHMFSRVISQLYFIALEMWHIFRKKIHFNQRSTTFSPMRILAVDFQYCAF